MADPDINDLVRRMDGAIEVLRREFAGLRTGRATPSLLEPVMVEAYGSEMPLNQLATISVSEPRMLSVQVWDKNMVKPVEKGILNADLGLNPMADGQSLRVPIPVRNPANSRTSMIWSAAWTARSKCCAGSLPDCGRGAPRRACSNR